MYVYTNMCTEKWPSTDITLHPQDWAFWLAKSFGHGASVRARWPESASIFETFLTGHLFATCFGWSPHIIFLHLSGIYLAPLLGAIAFLKLMFYISFIIHLSSWCFWPSMHPEVAPSPSLILDPLTAAPVTNWGRGTWDPDMACDMYIYIWIDSLYVYHMYIYICVNIMLETQKMYIINMMWLL